MNALLKEFIMPQYTARQKLYVWYAVISLGMLCTVGESIVWTVILVANFASAARLVRKIPIPKID